MSNIRVEIASGQDVSFRCFTVNFNVLLSYRIPPGAQGGVPGTTSQEEALGKTQD